MRKREGLVPAAQIIASYTDAISGQNLSVISAASSACSCLEIPQTTITVSTTETSVWLPLRTFTLKYLQSHNRQKPKKALITNLQPRQLLPLPLAGLLSPSLYCPSAPILRSPPTPLGPLCQPLWPATHSHLPDTRRFLGAVACPTLIRWLGRLEMGLSQQARSLARLDHRLP